MDNCLMCDKNISSNLKICSDCLESCCLHKSLLHFFKLKSDFWGNLKSEEFKEMVLADTCEEAIDLQLCPRSGGTCYSSHQKPICALFAFSMEYRELINSLDDGLFDFIFAEFANKINFKDIKINLHWTPNNSRQSSDWEWPGSESD